MVISGFLRFFGVCRFNAAMFGAYLNTSLSNTSRSGHFLAEDTFRSENIPVKHLPFGTLFGGDTFRWRHTLFLVRTLPGRTESMEKIVSSNVFRQGCFSRTMFSLALFCALNVSPKALILLFPAFSTSRVAKKLDSFPFLHLVSPT